MCGFQSLAVSNRWNRPNEVGRIRSSCFPETSAYIASGARSIPPGQATAPSAMKTCSKKRSSSSGSSAPVNCSRRKRTKPSNPSLNRTNRRNRPSAPPQLCPSTYFVCSHLLLQHRRLKLAVCFGVSRYSRREDGEPGKELSLSDQAVTTGSCRPSGPRVLSDLGCHRLSLQHGQRRAPGRGNQQGNSERAWTLC